MPPRLTRQESMQTLQQNQGPIALVCALCLSMPLAIACLVIAAEYDEKTSSCAEDTFSVDLVTFLDVAGGLGVALSCISICIACIGMVAGQEYGLKLQKMMKGTHRLSTLDTSTSKKLQQMCQIQAEAIAHLFSCVLMSRTQSNRHLITVHLTFPKAFQIPI